MVCYARPASRMAALLLVLFLVFGRSAAHFFDAAALMVAIAVAVGGAAVAAAVAFAVFRSVQRRRAAAGGCVSCQLRCQHAMTDQPRRLLMVSTVDRGAGGPSGPAAAGLLAAVAGSAAMRSWWLRGRVARGRGGAGPVVASRPTGRERAGSAVLAGL